MLGWINKKVGNSSKEDPGLPKAAATASKKKKQVQLPDPPQEAGDEADSKPRTLISKRIKPGRKHDNAMMAFTKGLWMQDGLATLRHLLLNDEAHKRFRKHVGKTGAAAVDLSAAYLKVERMPEGKREGSAAKVLKAFAPKTTKDNAKLGDGFGTAQSERTQATSELWEQMASSEEDLPVGECYAALEKEAERALQMLSVHAFPSFVQSAACDKLLKDLRSNGKKEEVDALQGALEKAGGAVPSSADDWLSMFVQFAEQFPACIVISDMSIPGAPMVYVNDEFTRVTGYDREEVVGRNCRFLQGPDSEPESIHVIRSTLSKAKPCHVLVTNYRKNGEKFNNLLSMQPVFDSDGIYRFVIGVQFEVVKDRTLLKRMVVLDRLLRLLPTKLGVPSKEGAKRRMFMAARSDGSANKAVAKQKDWGETVASNSDGFDAVFAMTRMLWMSNPEATLTKLVADVPSREVLKQFVAAAMSVATQGRLDFVMQAHDLKGATASQARMKHIVMSHNTLFYCTNNEIEIGTMMKQDFSPRGAIMQEIEEKRLQSLAVLAETMFSQFMNSKFGAKCVRDLWQREQANDPEDERAIETVSNGARVDTGPAAWLNGFMKSVENLNVAVVVSDMTAPGLPLAAVNPAFTTITGYSQEEAVGRNCKFLQGPETEGYVVDEIIWALREAQPTCVKLHNYTKEGRKMQFLVCLQPVFGAGGEYRFQVAFQMEFNESQNMLSRLEEMEVAMCLLPKSTSASGLAGSLSYTGDSCVLPHAAMAPPPEREAEKAASAEADSGDQMSSAVEVAGRKNVDHYGRQFGNKHKVCALNVSGARSLSTLVDSD
jgi:PAS domain S-box-containing protein